MKKRALTLLLAAVMVCALPPRSTLAADITVIEAIPLIYDRAGDFSDGLAAVGLWTGEQGIGGRLYRCGFIDKAGEMIIPFKYTGTFTYMPKFHEGLAAVQLSGKGWGFIDKTGREVVPCQYSQVSYAGFSDGLAAVQLDDKWGFIDKTGKETVPFKYDEVRDFSEGLAAVKLDGKWGFIDQTGREVVPCQYSQVSYAGFSDGLAAVKLDGKWGFIDKTGKEVVPCQYDDVKDFSEGLAAVKLDGKWGFIDQTGKDAVPCKYDEVRDFSEGFVAVGIGDLKARKWGFLDTTGTEIVPCKYDGVSYDGDFSEGLAAVTLNGKWGFIDTIGREVVPVKYDRAMTFSEGLAAVELNAKWGFIDKTGREVVPCKYSVVDPFHEGYAMVCDGDYYGNGKWGFLAIDGSTAAPAVPTAYASTQTVTVDGKSVTFNAYALKDANGFDTNYIKLRDVADVLSGTAAQFQVGWDGTIAITTGQMYTPNGTENIQNFLGDQTYTVNTSPVTVNGVTTDLEAITLTDASGGYTYFKLRDLGKALGFNITWDAQTGITIDPNSPYNAN